jgi:PAS domain S-box-containing protein
LNVSDSIDELQTRLKRKQDEQALILEITQRIAHGGSVAAILPDITKAALQGTGADGIRVILTGDGASVYASGSLAGQMLSFDTLILDQLKDRESLDLPDSSKSDEVFAPLRTSIGGFVALHLTAHGINYGGLWVAYSNPNSVSAGGLTFLSIVAGQIAVAIANATAFYEAKHEREQLAGILASSVDPVLVIDEHEKIVLFNPAAEHAFGVERSAVIGQPVERVINAAPLVELLKGTQATRNEAIEWQSESGEIYAPRISEFSQAGGIRHGRVLILRDITRYKNLRDNQTDFVRTVSHDLRSPLTYMHGYATMLPMVGTLNDKQKGFTDKIVAGIDQVTDMVDKILDAGRLDPEGNYELNREACDIYKLVTDVIGNHVQPAERHNLTLTTETDPGLPILNLDDMMLRRALNNLVDNAIKYTPEGGKVFVRAFTKDNSLILSVTDTGLGISEENQKHLFERFRRVRRREHNAVKGSGLGLYIVKNLAQKHGGDAWVESKEGQGSTFSIRIPIEGANLVVSEKRVTE